MGRHVLQRANANLISIVAEEAQRISVGFRFPFFLAVCARRRFQQGEEQLVLVHREGPERARFIETDLTGLSNGGHGVARSLKSLHYLSVKVGGRERLLHELITDPERNLCIVHSLRNLELGGG